MSVRSAQDIGFEAYGVRVRVTSNAPEVLERVPGLLPPGAQSCPAEAASESFGVMAEEGGTYRFLRGDSPVTESLDLDFALMFLESQLRMYVGRNALDRIFVHAGVVAHNGLAIVLPGLSLSGKTTLTLALVRAGALYYSDDYALLDGAGLVHPFPKPLSVRGHDQVQEDHDVGRYGGTTGDEPLKIGAVVFTKYRAGAEWNPQRLSAGQGVLAMLGDTLAARDRSEEALRVLNRAIDGALVLEGERGEAIEIVDELLASVGP